MAVCTIALHLARYGRYAEAESVTKFAAGQYAHFQKHSQIWKLTDLLMTFYRSLWLGHWEKAEMAVSQLSVFDGTESLARKAHLLLCQGDTSRANSALNKLEERLNEKQTSYNRLVNPGWKIGQKLKLQVQCLILRAVLLSIQQSYAEALLQISKAEDICRKHHMNLLLAMVSLQSAEIQVNSFRSFRAFELNSPFRFEIFNSYS